MAQILDGKALAERRRAVLKDKLREARGRPPHLVVVLASEDPASAIYVRNKKKAAEDVGIRSTVFNLPPTTPKDELLLLVAKLNADDDVDGVLVQLPIPKQHDELAVINSIRPDKDVDGFHPLNAGKLARGDESGLVPCTPLGVLQLIAEAGVNVRGKRAVVLGRSKIVGRPTAELLLNRDATVTVCHSKTAHLDEVVREAEVLVAAIGKAHFVKGSWVRPGAVVIDVGTNRLPNGKLTGDVAFHAAVERAGAITPVPGGVGPMTITNLLENTTRAAELRRGGKS
ncbi:MAG: bifunctional 5,10-methylenetetrahydrofolate dehydrogenase/5,10-methenyltetrahydrofolate cyclohydrolase [Deltaproteobacteria bacterium]|nr:bifunctional 5,10-methylenetetrahydrofolate dehydrogenase/5,10-methenyltetrahydrofolate cyclohydrolase [Deltaproteobacteria bacterium]